MNGKWKKATVTEIGLVVYVMPNMGTAVHIDRPYHGFIINTNGAVRDYYFSDGSVMHAGENELFYLPKGSSYRAVDIIPGGCYAINFSTLEEIQEPPFSIGLRNSEQILKSFKEAEKAWKSGAEYKHSAACRAIYDIIIGLEKEMEKRYSPEEKNGIISPAINVIQENFTDHTLTVAALAQLCGISEAYFRRLFVNKFGVSPKEYILMLRIDYAKQILTSGQFSVSDTAELCGFKEPCHFSREFSKRVGVSPREYKG